MKLELKAFDMSTLKDDSVVVFIGRRNTGKSVLVKDVMHRNQKLPVGVVISGTERANHHYETFIPGMFIYDEYEPDIIKKFLDRQEKICDQQFQEKQKYGGSVIDPRAFLILDDCLFDASWTSDKSIRYIFMNGRHLKIFFLITMQYPLGVPPSLRTNIDFVFILRENYVSNRKRIYENFAGMFPTFDVFCQIMDQCTENYECLVINNKVQSNKLEDMVFFYKAKMHDDFRVCTNEFWNLQAMENDKRASGGAREADDEEEYNANSIVTKKNAPKVRVVRR